MGGTRDELCIVVKWGVTRIWGDVCMCLDHVWPFLGNS